MKEGFRHGIRFTYSRFVSCFGYSQRTQLCVYFYLLQVVCYIYLLVYYLIVLGDKCMCLHIITSDLIHNVW